MMGLSLPTIAVATAVGVALIGGTVLSIQTYRLHSSQEKAVELQNQLDASAAALTASEQARKTLVDAVSEREKEVRSITAQNEQAKAKAARAVHDDAKAKAWDDATVPDYVRQELGTLSVGDSHDGVQP